MDRRAVYGPRDGTVLSQQSQHRSDEILDGDIDEVLQAKRADGKFWRNLREQDLPIRVQQILHQIGFYGVYRCGRIQYDCYLITALVERWRSETHSFHFRVEEATITLQDVQVIWGLPIDGEPVSGTDLERTSVQWQEYCMQYIGFAPEEGALKGSRLQVKAIIDHISRVHITPDTPHLTVVQYARLLHCSCWVERCVLIYQETCEKGKAAIDLGLVTHHSTCPGLGAPRVHMGHQIDNNRAPRSTIWCNGNCEHTFTRTVRTTVRVIRVILDEMQYDKIGFCSTYSTLLDGKDDMTRVIQDNPFPTEDIDQGYWELVQHITRHFVSSSTDRRVESGYQTGDAPMLQIVTQQVNTLQTLFQSKPVDVEGYRQLVAQLEHEVQIIAEAIKHQPQQTATPSDSAPTTSHRQRRSSSQMSISSVERGDIGVDIADLDLGLGINQPYAPEYNISPVPFPSFSAYRDNVESSSAASSSGLHINSGGDDNDGQNEPIQNMGEEIRRPRRQRHRRIFIKDLAKYRKDFRPLLKETESTKWKWEEIHTQRVRELKQVCNNLSKLAIPQDEDELVVYTDANDYRWAAVLMKKTTTGEEPCRHLRENLEELNNKFGRLAVNAQVAGQIQRADLDNVQIAIRTTMVASTSLWNDLQEPIRKASSSDMTNELKKHDTKHALRVHDSRPVAADSSTACTRPSPDSGEKATNESHGLQTSDDSSQPRASGVKEEEISLRPRTGTSKANTNELLSSSSAWQVYQRMWEKSISRKGVNPSKTIIETYENIIGSG
ncbi:Serine/threonine-protein phosphatase 7 long form [Sesamum angolense]|uniref:Serine/threonine-protein phosphatase 7 long form n=1 Tax=Sesamum angolense TaxID=2727404 RepID=A0AAE1VVV7_9LAMI|nr:Serine/threonine-protein phosphatase 7 long form [Sesamum angolense]